MRKDQDSKLAVLKHDIRNPLYAAKSLIESHLEFLEQAPPEHSERTCQETIRVLKRSAQELDRVFKTIRKLNQIADTSAAAKANGSEEGISIKEILHRMTRALKEARYLDHVSVMASIPPDLPAVRANRVDIEEVLFNLITNSAQATEEGDRLLIEAFFSLIPFRSVSISIEDTGSGISEEAIPHIFEPFYTGRVEEGGVGFGLYIVKQLVERNGGRIQVKSKPGAGTTFTVILPAA